MRTFPFIRSQRGASLVEYGILTTLVAVLSIPALVLLGPSVSSTFEATDTRLQDSRATADVDQGETEAFNTTSLVEETVVSGTFPRLGNYLMALDSSIVTPLAFSTDLKPLLADASGAVWSMQTIVGTPLPGLTLNPATGVLAMTDATPAPFNVVPDIDYYVVLRITAVRDGVTTVGDFLLPYGFVV